MPMKILSVSLVNVRKAAPELVPGCLLLEYYPMTRDQQLDEVDFRILEVLQGNARMETVYVASKVGRKPSATGERIERLIALGYIERFAAILNRRKVGRSTLMVTLVKLKGHSAEELRAFALAVKAYAEVQVVLHLSGEFDFLLQVSLRDPLEYEDFLGTKLCCLPMVDKVHSSLVLKEHKMEPALPLG